MTAGRGAGGGTNAGSGAVPGAGAATCTGTDVGDETGPDRGGCGAFFLWDLETEREGSPVGGMGLGGTGASVETEIWAESFDLVLRNSGEGDLGLSGTSFFGS